MENKNIINELKDYHEKITKEGKLFFAKQGIFNTRTDIDYGNIVAEGKRGNIQEPHWYLYARPIDPNIWNVNWCIPEYKLNNRKIKQIIFRDGNLKYKSHAVKRIFERNGFDPINLPKHIETTKWIQHLLENKHTKIINPEEVKVNVSDIQNDNLDWEQLYHNVTTGVEPRFPIPFLDGLLIVSQRIASAGHKVKFRKRDVSITELPLTPSFTAFTYLENLNEQQNNTLFYINNNQYSDAVDSYKKWIKNVNEINVLEDQIMHLSNGPDGFLRT